MLGQKIPGKQEVPRKVLGQKFLARKMISGKQQLSLLV